MPRTYEPIATQTLGSDTATVTFSSIPQTYTDLILVMNTKYTIAGDNYIGLQYNSDTASNYSNTYILGNGTSASSGRSTSQTSARVGNGTNSTSYYSTLTCSVMNYANATTNKTAIARSSDAGSYATSYVSLWRNTAAITSILILGDAKTFASGSTFTLYGIKAAA